MKRRPLPREASSVLSFVAPRPAADCPHREPACPPLSVPSVLWPNGPVKEDKQHVWCVHSRNVDESSVAYAVGGRAGRQLRHVFGSAAAVVYFGRPVGR
jgi:hypothetical protein